MIESLALMPDALTNRKLNILLINPPLAAVYGSMKAPTQLNMALAYLASMVEGENVLILDIDAERLTSKDFTAIIKNTKFDIAGFTVTTPTFLPSLQLARLIKEHSRGTRVVFGGVHPTIDPEGVLKHDCVDIVVKGEGEATFKELASCMKNGGDIFSLAGISFRENGTIRSTAGRPLIENLDSIPFPSRHLFKNKNYIYPDSLFKLTAPIITSRGCPGSCTYCNSRNMFGRSFRARGAKNVADEIEQLIKKSGVREFHIWDDNFTTIRKRVFEIKDEILRRGLKAKFAFPNGVRADYLDRPLLKALKDMGTYSLAVGVESGSQDVLDLARKGIKLDRIKEVFRLAKEEKIETWAFFMIGLPGETVETIKQTIAFAKKLDPDIAKFHILKPFPKSEVYEYLHARDFILTEDYNHYGIHTPPIHRLEGLLPAAMLKWQKKAYVSFYFRPTKIPKHILRTRSLNRFLLNLQAAAGLLKMIFKKDTAPLPGPAR